MEHKTGVWRRMLALLVTVSICGLAHGDVYPFRGHAQAQGQGQGANQVGIVIHFGDGASVTRCVTFSEPQISGYDALTRTGLNIVAAFDNAQGAAVCQIENTGCPVESCLTCDIPNYWSYWHLSDGNWSYSTLGASNFFLHHGDVDGWSWGGGTPPPVYSFDQICAPPPTNTPTVAPTPTATPLPTMPPTDTPLPATPTLSPSATPAPAATATSPPPTAWFRLDANPIPAGACTTVRWDTSYADAVYLDDELVTTNGSRQVCPSAPQEYRLRVVGAGGEQTYTLILGITGSTLSPTVAPTQPALPTTTQAGMPTRPSVSPAAGEVASAFLLTPSPTPASTSVHRVIPSLSSPTLVALPTPSESVAIPTPTATGEAIAMAMVMTMTRATEREPDTPTPVLSSTSSSISPKPWSAAVGYITFSLMVGGLVGWLAFLLTRRS